MYVKQSTAATVVLGPFVDSTDGVTAETGLTISQADIRLSKNGGAFAQTNNSAGATHMENGNYSVPLDSTDTNTLGRLRVSVAESGSLPCWLDLEVVTANVWDSLFSTDLLQVDVTQFGGTNATSSGGRPEVNTTHAAGTAWGAGAITATSIADNAITAAKIADGAIDAATFAANAINAAAIASDAVTEIQSGLATSSALATVDTVVDAILVDTAEIGAAGAGLTALGDTRLGNLDAAVSTRSTLSAANVNAEVVDALATDTYAEPGQGAPAATASLSAKISYLYKFLRNKITQTSTTLSVYADDGTTVDHKATTSDDATTYTRGEIVSGP